MSCFLEEKVLMGETGFLLGFRNFALVFDGKNVVSLWFFDGETW
jgi:hypothetical protein